MQLSVLENRILHDLPEEYHDLVEREFAKFESEISRMSPDEDKVGQATLTDSEQRKVRTTNQYGDYGHTIVELQCIKAVALKHNVPDWTSFVDPELTYEEVMSEIKAHANPTMKGMGNRR